MQKLLVIALVASVGFANAVAAGPFIPASLGHSSLSEKTHWVRKSWRGFSGPPYGIQYSRSYSYAFNSGYYEFGYGGCLGVQHMCASRWGWAGSAYRQCLRHHRWC